MMNRTITTLAIASLLSTGSFFAMASEKADIPPTAIPGVNQAQGAESNEQKADKKGEEASGSNSGAESQETEKDAATSSGSKGDEKTE
jgi:hypothetical protein